MIGMMWMHRVVLFLPSVRFVVCALRFIVVFFLRTRSVRGEGGALPDYIFCSIFPIVSFNEWGEGKVGISRLFWDEAVRKYLSRGYI